MNLIKFAAPLLTAIAFSAQTSVAFDHSHGDFDKVLNRYVANKKVDYAGLKADAGALSRYLNDLAKVSRSEFDGWNERQELAFLINLYNAATLKLVVDHYPVKSIKDIGGFKGPWKMPVVRALGGVYTLDQVEHELIRKNYDEPRIHFAVNCASGGCPSLRNEAYRSDRLEKQLHQQALIFMNDASKNRIMATEGKVEISPLFKWYKDDFVKNAGSLENYIAPYVPKDQQAAVRKGGLKIGYTDYDWSLNKK